MRTVLAVAVFMAAPAFGQSCFPYDDYTTLLKQKFGERIVFAGEAEGGHITQVWMNGSTGSWTLLIKRRDDVACLIDKGVNILMHPEGSWL